MRKIIIGAVLAALSTTLAVASPAAAEDRYTVTATVSATNIDVGQSFTVRGHVSPTARGEWAVVQRHTSTGGWAKVTRDKINKYGNYRATITVTEPGNNEYRVLKRHSRGHLRGVSPTVTVVGWRWRSVTTLPTYGTIANAAHLATGDLGPVAFPHTYQPLVKLGDPAGNDGSISYLLEGKCTKFDSEVGVTVDSASTDPQLANLGAIAQGGAVVQIAGQTVSRNQDPAHITRSGTAIEGAWAINLGGETTADNYVGWGNPRVYCKS
jgi:hypothetical protein